MMTLSLPLRRAGALSLLIAVVMTIYSICIDPFVSAYTGNLATATQLQAALERYRQAAARLPAMTQTLQNLRADQAAQQGYLNGTNEAVAAATLQDRLKGLVTREGGQLQSTQAMPQTQVPGNPQRVGIRAHMIARLDELQAVLYRLESEMPVLFVENLSIRVVTATAADEGLLDVNLDVIGYLGEASQ